MVSLIIVQKKRNVIHPLNEFYLTKLNYRRLIQIIDNSKLVTVVINLKLNTWKVNKIFSNVSEVLNWKI